MRVGPRAALWRRAAAAVLDGGLGLLVWILGAFWLVIAIALLRPGPTHATRLFLEIGAVLAMGLALHVVYHVGFVWGCGQTPGSMALGIAVTRGDGSRPGFWRVGIRLLGGWLAILSLGLAHTVPLVAGQFRGFGDWLAGTWVVRV
jgi:uncharacterized RDD family membrane protein YckC